MLTSVPVRKLITKSKSMINQPAPVSRRSINPLNARVLMMGRLIRRSFTAVPQGGAENLRAFERHFNDKLIGKPYSSCPAVCVASKDVHKASLTQNK